MTLLINKTSEKVLSGIIKNLPQSLLITGEVGIGLITVAKYIASQQNMPQQIILPEKDEKIDLGKGVISIDIIRHLYEDTRTKTTSGRIIIIDYAERMTVQAQNAFLKLLEEPNPGTYFILLSHSASKLLPTIVSRTEKLDLKPISDKQSDKLLDDLNVTDQTKRSQILFISAGLPAEMTRLATDDAYFTRRSEIVRDAKVLLGGSLYQKLLIAQRYRDDRSATLSLLLDAANILQKSLSSQPETSSIHNIEKIMRGYERVEANGNIRLCLANMVI